MPKLRRSNNLLVRLATFTPSSYDAAKRTIGVVWSTGAPVARQDFEGPFTERLDMTPDAVDLSQLRGAPVLNSHDRFDVRSILGVVENPAVENGRGTATVRFSDRPEIAGIVRDIEQGIISRVSVGYTRRAVGDIEGRGGQSHENRDAMDACRNQFHGGARRPGRAHQGRR